MRRYTEAEKAWLVDNYHTGTINDTLDAFEAEFGRRPSRQALFVKANSMGLRKDQREAEPRRKAETRMRWSDPNLEDERNWMLARDDNESIPATIDAFEAEFGIRLTRTQVSTFRSTHGKTKDTKHGGGHPSRPVGSERMGKDGYVMVKVREWPDVPCTKDNWRFKHHIAWEQANGKPVPKGHVVLFADHDTRNFDSDNLVLVPRKYVARLNSPDTPEYFDRESLEACIALCDLNSKMRDIDFQHCTCELCGREFSATEQRRNYAHVPKTCPECLAAGRKARGDRGDKQPTICAVCGNTFMRTQRNQLRCFECIAAKPKWNPGLHRRYYVRHGHR